MIRMLGSESSSKVTIYFAKVFLDVGKDVTAMSMSTGALLVPLLLGEEKFVGEACG